MTPLTEAQRAELVRRAESYAGNFRLWYVPAGTTTVLAETEFSIATGQAKMAVLERAVDGSYRVTIVDES